jgi:membrane-associated protease RseP (regulator of RpoE activity)
MRAKLLLGLPACVLCVLAACGQTTQPNGSNSGGGKGLDAVFDSNAASGKSTGARDWWGVKTQPLPLRLEGENPIPAAEVVELKPGSAAARAGLRQGDLIVGVQMRQLANRGDLDRAVAGVQPGGKLALQVVREGNPVEITVTRGGTSSGGGLAQTSQPGVSPAAAEETRASSRTGVFINEREITPTQVQELRATYGYVAPPGRYWYDPASGLYGVIGREAAGFMQPGHDFGTLPANASNGTTGVFINGRQINMAEAMYCQRLFGAVYQGRWWLDGRTGNLGAEGSPVPIANVYMALQQSQRSSQGGGYSWHSNTTGASGGSDGKCSYVSIPGSGSVMTGNCD